MRGSRTGILRGTFGDDATSLRRLTNVHLGPLVAALLLSVIGLATVASATAVEAESFLPRQVVWIGLGLLVLLAAALVDYHALVEGSPVLFAVGLLVLALVPFLGREVSGAKSWLVLGPFTVQPSEVHKILTVLLLTRYLASRERAYLRLSEILTATTLVAVPMVLIALQPDMGTAVMYLPALGGMLLVAGIRPRLLLAAALLGVVLAAGLWQFGLKDYQRQRITTFLQPEQDPLGAGYQVRQSKIAVGSGQWSGRGFGQGTQSQLRFLPARHSDFVMAVWAEEWGFLGVGAVFAFYALFFFSAAQIALRSRDRAGVLLVVGLVSLMAAHVIYSTGMVVGLLPITGIPLPFISYGGSFMLFNFFATGLILNVDYRRYVNR